MGIDFSGCLGLPHGALPFAFARANRLLECETGVIAMRWDLEPYVGARFRTSDGDEHFLKLGMGYDEVARFDACLGNVEMRTDLTHLPEIMAVTGAHEQLRKISCGNCSI